MGIIVFIKKKNYYIFSDVIKMYEFNRLGRIDSIIFARGVHKRNLISKIRGAKCFKSVNETKGHGKYTHVQN